MLLNVYNMLNIYNMMLVYAFVAICICANSLTPRETIILNAHYMRTIYVSVMVHSAYVSTLEINVNVHLIKRAKN